MPISSISRSVSWPRSKPLDPFKSVGHVCLQDLYIMICGVPCVAAEAPAAGIGGLALAPVATYTPLVP